VTTRTHRAMEVIPDAPDPVRASTRGRKDRKRWCRGKVGVPHTETWLRGPGRFWTLTCSACGKTLDWDWSGKRRLKAIEAAILAECGAFELAEGEPPAVPNRVGRALTEVVQWIVKTEMWQHVPGGLRYIAHRDVDKNAILDRVERILTGRDDAAGMRRA